MAPQLDATVICGKGSVSECSTCVASLTHKFSAIRLSLELPLQKVYQSLKLVDNDLAELAAQMLEQASAFVNAIENYTETESGTDKKKTSTTKCHSACKKKNVQQEANKCNGSSSDLLEQLRFLRQCVLNLQSCTDVVRDHQLMLVLGEDQQRNGAEACRQALEQLCQVSSTLKFLSTSIE